MDFLPTALIAIVALALSVGVGAPITAGMLRLISHRDAGRGPDSDSSADAAAGADPPGRGRGGVAAQELLRGGLWIGLLERFAVSGCILVGYPAGIAVVVAIKGLARFSTLQEAQGAGVSERFLVGTLASYLWAALVALAALGVLQTIP